MKKVLSLVVAMCLVLVLTSAALAGVNPAASKINKNAYDNYGAQKQAANNDTVSIDDGISLVSNSKAGWYIAVDNPAAKGTIEVAYKVGSDYYLLQISIDGAGNYPIGDGSGKDGVNHAKISWFAAPVEEAPIEAVE